MITVALDFDGTITAAPELWAELIWQIRERGHEVVIITNRGDHHPDSAEGWAKTYAEGVRVVRAYGDPKEAVCREMGLEVDIWIDDEPWKIREGP